MNSVKNRPLSDLLEVIEKLRHPKEGCPWDLEQTSKSLIPYIIEEAYELVEVLEAEDTEKVCDELGDLLLQIVFQAQIAKEQGFFDIEKVISKAVNKMIRRHPHIFGNKKKTSDVKEQKTTWESIKKQERVENGEDSSPFKKENRLLPAINQAMKLQNTASSLGLDFKDVDSITSKILEELTEIKEAIDKKYGDGIKGEIGDLLFSTINLARFLKLDPETCIRQSNEKFSKRCIEYFKKRDKFEKEHNTMKGFSRDDTWKTIKFKENN